MAEHLPPDVERLEQRALRELLGRFAQFRLIIAPVPGAFLAVICIYEPSPWRRACLASAVASLVAWSVVELWRYRNGGTDALDSAPTFLLLALAQILVCSATGGVESPLLPTFVPLDLFATLFGRRRLSATIWVMQMAFLVIASTWAIVDQGVGVVPLWLGGGSLVGHAPLHIGLQATVMAIVLSVAVRSGLSLRETVRAMVARIIGARDELLTAHAEQSQALTSMAGEIAHELKNPLASVKGLAALISKDQPEGKPAERMAVLRREVDRMQDILEAFLNFSRPLAPLAQESVDLRALGEGVVALHEGLAHARGIRIELREQERVEVRCDPRKVRQVLINLMQNALDASPADAAIELVVGREQDRARVQVCDSGPGLSDELAQRAFEPGVTTKPKGSGLGLAIARGLARQHGGELALHAGKAGGCVAELLLPLGGAETGA